MLWCGLPVQEWCCLQVREISQCDTVFQALSLTNLHESPLYSDANSLCCQNCQAAPTTYICSAAGNSTTTCTGDAYCEYPLRQLSILVDTNPAFILIQGLTSIFLCHSQARWSNRTESCRGAWGSLWTKIIHQSWWENPSRGDSCCM